jgi:dimethylaniline monooxygenase (N-oxide forming)
VFWSKCGLSVVHDKKFLEMVAAGKLIHVHRATITSFGDSSITLSTGPTLLSDITVFCTGWTLSQSRIFAPQLLPSLGLPHDLAARSPDDVKHWDDLDKASEQEIKNLFPLLAHPPPHVREYDEKHAPKPTMTPFRLFRGIAPPVLAEKGDRDLVVLGILLNTAIPTYAEISSLWGVAYLEGLPMAPSATSMLASRPKMEKEVSMINSWGVVRYRDAGISYLDGSVEIQDFMDVLVRDLGLKAERKQKRGLEKWHLFGARAWLREWFAPYRGQDYKGIVDEYLERWGLEVVPKVKVEQDVE